MLPLFATAPALIPCPSLSPRLPSPLRWLLSLARQCLPSPVVAAAAAAAAIDGGGIVAVHPCPCRSTTALTVPSTSVIQRRHNHCRHQPSLPPLLGEVPNYIQRNQLTSK